MMEKNLIPDRGGVWIDAYNQCASEDVAGTITTRIDGTGSYWVTEAEPINTAAGGTAHTITTRYGAMCDKNVVDGARYPMTAILEIDMEEPKIMQIGNYTPNGACSGKVVSPEGISPTFMDNHGMHPAVILDEAQMLTSRRTEEAKERRRQGTELFAGRELVPRTDGVSNTITTVEKDNLLREPIACASRGRGETPQQRLELGGNCANAVTTVAKDSMVAEPVIAPGTVIANTQENCYRGSVEGVSPCICAAGGMGGGHVPMVSEEPKILGYSRSSDSDGKVTNYHANDVANTCHGSTGMGGNTDQFVMQPLVPWRSPGNATDISHIISSSAFKHNHVLLDMRRYRIRKLTPREAYRLMDVSEDGIDKLLGAEKTVTLKNGKTKTKPAISNSKHYQLAGNSIVVNCLYHIFKNMFIDNEAPRQTEGRQLSLFDDSDF